MKREQSKYLLMAFVICVACLLTGCSGANKDGTYSAIQGFTNVYDILVWPMAGLMWLIGKTVAFGNYGVVIIISTLIVRTCAWPIYAKTNDMSLKMNLMAPEQAKIQARYEGKTDQESQQRMQMEMMNLYKKYGVGIGGCLMPFVQFPLFIAFYTTLQRIPYTLSSSLKFNFSFLNGTFLGVNLFLPRGEALEKVYENAELLAQYGLSSSSYEAVSKAQNIGIIVIAVIVGLTQIAMQLYAQHQQKKAKDSQFADVPEYRRPQQTDQAKQTQMTMNIMMYGMSIMMVFMVLQNTAALGLYWVVGNIYSFLQQIINKKLSKKRLEKLKAKLS